MLESVIASTEDLLHTEEGCEISASSQVAAASTNGRDAA